MRPAAPFQRASAPPHAAVAAAAPARPAPPALAPARPHRLARQAAHDARRRPPTTTTPGVPALTTPRARPSPARVGGPPSATGGGGEAAGAPPTPPLSMPGDPPGLPPLASPAAAAAAAAWVAEGGPPGAADDTRASGFLTAAKGEARTVPAFNKYRARTSIKKENYSAWVSLMAAEVRGAWRTAAAAAAGRGGSAAVARAAGLDPDAVTEEGPTFRIPRSAIENARPAPAAMAAFWAGWAWNVATPEPVRYAVLRVWRVLGPRVWAARVALLGVGARLDRWCAARGTGSPSLDLAHALRRWHGKVGPLQDLRYRWALLRGRGGAAAGAGA